MTPLITRFKTRLARQTLAFKVTCLLACAAMLLSYHQRALLRSFLARRLAARAPPVVVFAIGNPSTDKDTFIAQLARDFGLRQVVVGPWLSSLRERPDQVGALARKYWDKQVPMPASHLVPLLKAHLNELRDHAHSRFLIDGFPRTRDSAEAWERRVGKPDLVLYFETPLRRASAQYAGVVRRRFDSVSGVDERRLVEQRFEEHENETSGLMDLYEQGGRVLKIAAPDDTKKSYAKVIDTLRAHPRSAKIFGLVDKR